MREFNNIFHPPFLRVGVARELQNLTGYDESRKMPVRCPVCEIIFHRAPSHVARVNVSTCSRACAAEARKVRVSVPCVMCGKLMEVIPAYISRKTTCSKACSSLKKRKGHRGPSRGSAAYMKATKTIKRQGRCDSCGATHGPWVVKGIKPIPDSSPPEVDSSEATLLCRSCYHQWLGPIAVQYRHWRPVRASGGNGSSPRRDNR